MTLRRAAIVAAVWFVLPLIPYGCARLADWLTPDHAAPDEARANRQQ